MLSPNGCLTDLLQYRHYSYYTHFRRDNAFRRLLALLFKTSFSLFVRHGVIVPTNQYNFLCWEILFCQRHYKRPMKIHSMSHFNKNFCAKRAESIPRTRPTTDSDGKCTNIRKLGFSIGYRTRRATGYLKGETQLGVQF